MNRTLWTLVVILAPGIDVALTPLAAALKDAITIELLNDPQRIAVGRLSAEELTQLDQEDETALRRLLRVRVQPAEEHAEGGESRAESAPPLFGSYEIQQDRLCFIPRYPLEAGLSYQVEFRWPQRTTVSKTIQLPEVRRHPSAVVTAVYPSGDVLPENQLKFYLHFSAPMSRGEAYQRVHLFELEGGEIDAPFLELEQELWDGAGTRFTLFFDPGRIKRGLRPHEEVGPSLLADRTYRFVIDRDWLDAHGQPLAEPFEKRFRVTGPDDLQPSPSRWQVRVPTAGSREALVIRFDEPLDHAMLLRVTGLLKVGGTKEESVAVTRLVGEGERSLRLLPSEPWQTGDYAFTVRTDLEDLAGNSIAKPFEIDLFEKVDRRLTVRFHRLPFSIGD